MNRWAWPFIIIAIIVLSILIYMSQNKNKNEPNLSPIPDDSFQIISPSPSSQQNVNQQQPEPTLETEKIITASIAATIRTTKGDITLVLRGDMAPNTVKTFISKAKSGFYNNLTFHRVEDWVIQGGDPNGNGTGGGNIPVEFNNLPFVTGAIGSASRGDGKVQNDSQFFITKSDASWLNGQYTNFGTVTEGIEVVNKIQIGDKILGIIFNN